MPGNSTNVISIRIDADLDKTLDKLSQDKGMKKVEVIRNFLHLADYIFIDKSKIQSINKNEMLILKRNFINKLVESLPEVKQIDFGEDLARFINDVARIEGKIEDIEYKLAFCERLGFFNKFIDNDGYILFSKKFGPQRFVEAFVWELIHAGKKRDFDRTFTTESIEDSSKKKKEYNSTIQPVHRDSTYYAFEFARIKEE